MCSKDQIKELERAMNDRAQAECERGGGYPNDYEVIGGFLVGAVLDSSKDCALRLTKVPVKDAMRLLQEAKAGLKEGHYDDLEEAMYEVGL